MYMYTHIYPGTRATRTCNPHLGLINAPPLFVFPLKTTVVTIHLLSARPEIYQMLAKSCSIFSYYQKGPVGGPGTLLMEGVY